MLQIAESELRHVRVWVPTIVCVPGRRPPAGTFLWNRTQRWKDFFHLLTLTTHDCSSSKQPAAPPQDDQSNARRRRVSSTCPMQPVLPPSGQNRLRFRPSRLDLFRPRPPLTFADLQIFSVCSRKLSSGSGIIAASGQWWRTTSWNKTGNEPQNLRVPTRVCCCFSAFVSKKHTMERFEHDDTIR